MKKLILIFLIILSCTKESDFYTLTTSSNLQNAGTVLPTSGQYAYGEIVTIKAIPSPNYAFHSWVGHSSDSSSIKIFIKSNNYIQANFFSRDKNDLLSFSILKRNNPKLKEDLIFEIKDSIAYKYVPDFIDAKNLIPTFSHNAKSIILDSIIQISDSTSNNFNKILYYDLTSLNGDKKRYKINLESFTGLPVLLINTENQEKITSKENYITGHLRFIGRDYITPHFSESIKIRGRGHYTWTLPKKPYQLKFKNKVSFLDMSSDKKWIFLANYTDKTLSRNAISFHLGRISNLDWTSKSDFAEVFINGNYDGTYQITEKVEEDDHRVNIGKDGYLLEIDQYDRLNENDIFFRTPRLVFNVKSPDLNYDSEEYNYVKNYVRNFEKVLYSKDFKSNEIGYKNLIDIDSFVDWYLINEISKNNDSQFYSSCYMTLIPGEKLIMGPLWDYDLAFGNSRLNGTENPEGFLIKNSSWMSKMFDDPEFVDKVKNRFLYFYYQKDQLINFSNELSEKLKQSRIENNKRWNTLGKLVWPNYAYKFSSFEEEQNYLNNWINDRFEWLKNEYEKM